MSEDYATAWHERSYQAANRFSHLSWLLDVLDENAGLVNIYFLHDSGQPTSRAEWDSALDVAEKDPGLASITVPNSGRVFPEAGERDELLAAPTPSERKPEPRRAKEHWAGRQSRCCLRAKGRRSRPPKLSYAP